MPYPRLFYGFSVILQLNMHFIARYLILAFCVNRWKNGQFLGPFKSIEKKSKNMAETSRRPNVATSGQREEEVNKYPTSRRQCDFCLTIIKSKRDQKTRGIEKRSNKSTERRATTTQISGEETYFCIFSCSDKIVDVL